MGWPQGYGRIGAGAAFFPAAGALFAQDVDIIVQHQQILLVAAHQVYFEDARRIRFQYSAPRRPYSGSRSNLARMLRASSK